MTLWLVLVSSIKLVGSIRLYLPSTSGDQQTNYSLLKQFSLYTPKYQGTTFGFINLQSFIR